MDKIKTKQMLSSYVSVCISLTDELFDRYTSALYDRIMTCCAVIRQITKAYWFVLLREAEFHQVFNNMILLCKVR